MYVKKDDVNSVFKALGLAIMDLKADTVMLPRAGRIHPMKMYYHNETVGWSSFLLSESDPSRFVAVDAGTLFSLLQGLDASLVPGRPVVRAGIPSKSLIDLSSMLEDTAIVADIHFAMKQLWKSAGMNRGGTPGEIPSEVIEGIKGDLAALCKDNYGMTEAKRLWSIYRPVIGSGAPNLEEWAGLRNVVRSKEVILIRDSRREGGPEEKKEDGGRQFRSRRH